MCSLRVPRILNHQLLLNMYKANFYSFLTARKKTSLAKNSLKIQAKRCDFILNPEVVRSVASDGKFSQLLFDKGSTEYFQRIACLLM